MDRAIKKHPIQLCEVRVINLSYERLQFNENKSKVSYQLATGSVALSQDNEYIVCGIKAECKGENEGKTDFTLCAEIEGIFTVKRDEFDFSNIETWQNKNAPYILMPYLREQIYSLSVRSGIRPIILPLVEIPTTKSSFEKKKSST